MITEGPGWILRHIATGRYFNSDALLGGGDHRDTWGRVVSFYKLVDSPLHADLVYGPPDAPFGSMFRPTGDGWHLVRDQFEIIPGPGCACCGELRFRMHSVSDGTFRCEKHKARNPCAIEGCRRTTAARQGWYSSDDWLCGTHWKIACPPRSPLRRAYHRIWRIRRKAGEWTPGLHARYWRLMRGIIARARGRDCGAEDLAAEVAKAMGWAA